MSVQAEQAVALIETLSLFAQDTWSATPRLNSTYGVRRELTPPPSKRSESKPSAELWPARYTQSAPRPDAASPAAQKSVLRGGWGMLYGVALDPINRFRFNAPTFQIGGPRFMQIQVRLRF